MYFIITYYCLQHKSPDYSAVYIVFETDGLDNIEGHGLTFTLGRGNELGILISPTSNIVLASLLNKPQSFK